MNDVPFSEPITLKLQSVGEQGRQQLGSHRMHAAMAGPGARPHLARSLSRLPRRARRLAHRPRGAHRLRQGGAHRRTAGHGTLIHLNINPPERQ
jgi:hypothetical protein